MFSLLVFLFLPVRDEKVHIPTGNLIMIFLIDITNESSYWLFEPEDPETFTVREDNSLPFIIRMGKKERLVENLGVRDRCRCSPGQRERGTDCRPQFDGDLLVSPKDSSQLDRDLFLVLTG